MSQMNPKEVFHNTAYSVQLPLNLYQNFISPEFCFQNEFTGMIKLEFKSPLGKHLYSIF